MHILSHTRHVDVNITFINITYNFHCLNKPSNITTENNKRGTTYIFMATIISINTKNSDRQNNLTIGSNNKQRYQHLYNIFKAAL